MAETNSSSRQARRRDWYVPRAEAPQTLQQVASTSSIQRSADGACLQLSSSLVGPAGAALQFSQSEGKWAAHLSQADGSSQELKPEFHNSWQLADGTTVSLGYQTDSVSFRKGENAISLQLNPKESKVRGASATVLNGDHYENVFHYAPGSGGVSGFTGSNQLRSEQVVSRALDSVLPK